MDGSLNVVVGYAYTYVGTVYIPAICTGYAAINALLICAMSNNHQHAY